MVAPEDIAKQAVNAVKVTIPQLLDLASGALKTLPLPTSRHELDNMDVPTVLALLPFLSAIVALLVSVGGYVLTQDHTHQDKSASYWLTRRWLLRGMGVIYFAAFATSAFQGRALYGVNGLSPVDDSKVGSGRPTPAFTCLMWITGQSFSDWMLEFISWLGLTFASILVYNPARSMFILVLLWTLYLSIINLETLVINYGWEWLTVELGFLSIFLCPVVWPPGQGQRFPRHHQTPVAVIWLFRWCAFRLLIGAGMSKVGTRSSECWLTLQCTKTHYFTQPMPNRLSWWFHHLPDWFHETEVALTFFEQLVLPFFILVPVRSVGILAALLEIGFQFMIVATGNYAWINFVGALPCVAALDDEFLSRFYNEQYLSELASKLNTTPRIRLGRLNSVPSTPKSPRIHGQGENISQPRVLGGRGISPLGGFLQHTSKGLWSTIQILISITLVLFIGFKSIAPLQELFSPSPWLHYYDEYFFVSSQGVFGFINQKRAVAVLAYTHDDIGKVVCKDIPKELPFQQGCNYVADYCGHDEYGEIIREKCARSCGQCTLAKNVSWKQIQFKNLPGDIYQSPRCNSPYHYRFDWQVWITTTAGMDSANGDYHSTPGILRNLVGKLLVGDTDAIGLLETNQLELLHGIERRPPTAISLQYYWYTYTNGSALFSTGAWWQREKLGKEVIFLADEKGKPAYTDGYWQRHWILFWSCIGIAVAFDSSLSDGLEDMASNLLQILCCVACFTLTLFGDHEAQVPHLKDMILELTGTADDTIIVLTIASVTIATLKFWNSGIFTDWNCAAPLISILLLCISKQLP